MKLHKGQPFSQTVLAILLEVVFILLAVFLGLVANEYRVSQNQKKYSEKVIAYIHDEIKSNMDCVEAVLPYHKTLKASLDSLSFMIFQSDQKKMPLIETFSVFSKGFNPPVLASTGWQIANNTEIMTNMDLRLAVALSDLYDLQSFLEQKTDKIGENFYIAENINPGDVKQLVVALDFLMNDIIVQEEKLMTAYPRVLEKLSSN